MAMFGADNPITSIFGGDFLGEMPGFDAIFETPTEAAGAANLATMADVGRQYEAYRLQSEEGHEQAQANMAGMMGGLNSMVMDNTGYDIDFDAAMTPVTNAPPVSAVEAPKPDAGDEYGEAALWGGAALIDPLATGLGYLAFG